MTFNRKKKQCFFYSHNSLNSEDNILSAMKADATEAIVTVVNLYINNIELCRAGCGALFNIAKSGSHALCC